MRNRDAFLGDFAISILISNVLWEADGGHPLERIASRLHVDVSKISNPILIKKSLDARHHRQEWRAVYRVDVEGEAVILERNLPSVRQWTSRDEGRYGLDVRGPVPLEQWPKNMHPIVVGAGPAGLFAALYLAEAGASVTLVERGQPVDQRVKVVNRFWRGKSPLNKESNLVYGEGGAGTFSDGKIYTRRRDGELGYIFRRLVDFGASPDIMHEAWAHLGTDRVRKILPVFRKRLEELGVEIHFGARVTDILTDQERAIGVVLESGRTIEGGPILIAAGHSARDTAMAMVNAGAAAEPCPIAIGARIEHLQTMVDLGRYGKTERGELPPASYRLSCQLESGGKAHTFCMCPGGMVVPATNHEGRVVVNGMSFSTRMARWANSAVIVAIEPEEYGYDGSSSSLATAGYEWQDAIERRCFDAAGGSYQAPAQRVIDFLEGRVSETLPKVSYPLGVVSLPLHELLPSKVVSGMREAILQWEKDIPGFSQEGVLIGPETRTTSPIRFQRTQGGQSTTLEHLYPVGEGAGYGGGIVSCALDGIRAARDIVFHARATQLPE